MQVKTKNRRAIKKSASPVSGASDNRQAPTRPVVRESSRKTQEILLNAALREFSEKGYDGARVDQIALLTGLNKNVLYHHFSSKDRLFAAVLERTYTVIRKNHNEISLRGMDPVAAIRKLVIATGRIWLRSPEFQQMIRCENLLEGRHVKTSNNMSRKYDPLLDNLRELLQRGIDEGVFRKSIDAVDLYISISALTAHYINNRYTLETIFHEDLMSPKRVKQRLDHAADMVLRYIVK